MSDLFLLLNWFTVIQKCSFSSLLVHIFSEEAEDLRPGASLNSIKRDLILVDLVKD